tara:strand:+ start:262 stop:645 length:384 start_codon:yes stop_codon:yes gene_type:complete
MEAIVYYRKDPSWLATSPLAPPELDSPDALVEVHRVVIPMTRHPFEFVWQKMQAIDGRDDWPVMLGVRSMMIGDVVAIGESAREVAATGWKDIECSWLTDSTVAPPHQHNVLVSGHAEGQEHRAPAS